jgi:hypothetical protein
VWSAALLFSAISIQHIWRALGNLEGEPSSVVQQVIELRFRNADPACEFSLIQRLNFFTKLLAYTKWR